LAADAMAALARFTLTADAASADFLSAADFAAAAAAFMAAYLHRKKTSMDDYTCIDASVKILLGSRFVASNCIITGKLCDLQVHTPSTELPCQPS
jgi:hypothetical protein